MTSVASGGTTDRITERTFSKVLRAGSGTPARYSSTFFGAVLPFIDVSSRASAARLLPCRHRLRHLVDAVPRCRGLQRIVHVADVLHAFVFQPCAEGGCALLGEDGDAVFPGGAPAEHAVELHAGFGSELQVFNELGIADPR